MAMVVFGTFVLPLFVSRALKIQRGTGFCRHFFRGKVSDLISNCLSLNMYVHYTDYQCHLYNSMHN